MPKSQLRKNPKNKNFKSKKLKRKSSLKSNLQQIPLMPIQTSKFMTSSQLKAQCVIKTE